MPCDDFSGRLEDGTPFRGVLCSRRGPRVRCAFCPAWGDWLCDHPVQTKAGKTKDCNKRMCDRHRTHVGPDLDYCPLHAEAAQPVLPLGPGLEAVK